MQGIAGSTCQVIANETLCTAFREHNLVKVTGILTEECEQFYESNAIKFCDFATIPNTTRYTLLAMVLLVISFGSLGSLFLIVVFMSDRILLKVNHVIIVNLALADFVLLAVFGSFKIIVLVSMVLEEGWRHLVPLFSVSVSLCLSLSPSLSPRHAHV